MPLALHRPALRSLAGLFTLGLVTACGPIEIPVTLELDPAGPNRLEVQLPPSSGGALRESQLVGSVDTTVVLDTDELLSEEGVVAMIRVDDLRIAGTSFEVLGPGTPTGTVCLEPDPQTPSGGVAFLRPLLKKEADFQLTLATLASATSPQLAPVAPPLPFQGTIDTTVPLDLEDLLALAAGEPGALTLTETVQDTLPADVLLLGGSEVTVTVTLTNTDAPAGDPLLDECEAFFAGM